MQEDDCGVEKEVEGRRGSKKTKPGGEKNRLKPI